MDFPTPIPFVDLLGFKLVYMRDGTSRLTYDPEAAHLNSFQVTHGGASMTLLDVTMAHAARSLNEAMGVVTVEMKTAFMQPAKGLLTAEGKVLHRTATLAFTEGTIHDAMDASAYTQRAPSSTCRVWPMPTARCTHSTPRKVTKPCP